MMTKLVGKTGFLEIFTNEEAKPKKDWTWFYQTTGIENSEDGGDVKLCHCAECCNFGKDILEYFSIYTALTWAEENHSEADIDLWVSSEKFIFEHSEKLFYYYEDTYKCTFLRTLAKDLVRLLRELEVEVFHYSYANKDIIPRFFKKRWD